MNFLLDTVVLSEARKPLADRNVVQWLRGVPASAAFVSVIALSEIQRGIVMARRRDPAFATGLERWLAGLQTTYADRIIDIDRTIALRWGQIAGEVGHSTPDIAIAATAHVHRLVVATRNADDFLRAGVPVLNPFQPSPQIIRPRV